MHSLIFWFKNLFNIRRNYPRTYRLLSELGVILTGAVVVLGGLSIASFGLYWMGRLIHSTKWMASNTDECVASRWCNYGMNWVGGVLVLVAIPVILLLCAWFGNVGDKVIRAFRNW